MDDRRIDVVSPGAEAQDIPPPPDIDEVALPKGCLPTAWHGVTRAALGVCQAMAIIVVARAIEHDHASPFAAIPLASFGMAAALLPLFVISMLGRLSCRAIVVGVVINALIMMLTLGNWASGPQATSTLATADVTSALGNALQGHSPHDYLCIAVATFLFSILFVAAVRTCCKSGAKDRFSALGIEAFDVCWLLVVEALLASSFVLFVLGIFEATTYLLAQLDITGPRRAFETFEGIVLVTLVSFAAGFHLVTLSERLTLAIRQVFLSLLRSLLPLLVVASGLFVVVLMLRPLIVDDAATVAVWRLPERVWLPLSCLLFLILMAMNAAMGMQLASTTKSRWPFVDFDDLNGISKRFMQWNVHLACVLAPCLVAMIAWSLGQRIYANDIQPSDKNWVIWLFVTGACALVYLGLAILFLRERQAQQWARAVFASNAILSAAVCGFLIAIASIDCLQVIDRLT